MHMWCKIHQISKHEKKGFEDINLTNIAEYNTDELNCNE